jgi:TM2 domain-containing membrane protein YozV
VSNVAWFDLTLGGFQDTFLIHIVLSMRRRVEIMSKSGTAAVLSFFIPGVGQFYNGAFWRGIFWLIITPGFWLGTGGLLGWICHLISAYTAYSYARKNEFTFRAG